MALLSNPLSPEVLIAQDLATYIAETEGIQELTRLSDPSQVKDRHIFVGGGDSPPDNPRGYSPDLLQQEHVLIFIDPGQEDQHVVSHPNAAGVNAYDENGKPINCWDEVGVLNIFIRETPRDYDVQNEDAKQGAYLRFWDCVSAMAHELPTHFWAGTNTDFSHAVRSFYRIGGPGWISVERETGSRLTLQSAYSVEWGPPDVEGD